MNYYKKFITALAAVTCSAAITNTAVAEEQSADLTLKYEHGKVYYNTQTTNMLMDIAPGMQMNNLMVISLKGAAQKHAKGTQVAVSYEGLKMKVKMGQNVMAEYDSSKKDNNPQLSAQLDPMLKTKFSAIFDDKGNYVGAEGLENFKLDPKAGLTKESLEAMMKQATVMLPNRKVKVGESWKAEIKVPMQGMGKMEMSFDEKLVSIDKVDGRNLAKIVFTGKIKPLEVDQNGVKVKVASKAINGSILFDLDLHQAYKTEMNMELNMEAAGQKMSMSAITTQELTKVEAAK